MTFVFANDPALQSDEAFSLLIVVVFLQLAASTPSLTLDPREVAAARWAPLSRYGVGENKLQLWGFRHNNVLTSFGPAVQFVSNEF